MASKRINIMDRLGVQRSARIWSRITAQAHALDLGALRKMRVRARQMRDRVDEFLFKADERLAMQVADTDRVQRPAGSDWAWRPKLWRGRLARPGLSSVPSRSRLGDEIQLFHDCKLSELTLRQIRNTREDDLAPYGLRMDVFSFDGSFLSLVLDLPKPAVEGLNKAHVLRLDVQIQMETPLEIFARLNIKNGPNTEQLLQELPLDKQRVIVEFDLAYSELNEKRVEGAWLDLIFEGPQMNQIVLRDLTLSRRLRADL